MLTNTAGRKVDTMIEPMIPEPAGLSDAECDGIFMRGQVIAALEALAPASISGSDDDLTKAMRHLIRAIASALGTRSEVQEAAQRVADLWSSYQPLNPAAVDAMVALVASVKPRAALGEAPK